MILLNDYSYFDDVYKMLTEYFQFDEYRLYDNQKAILADDNYSLYQFVDDSTKELIGFISFWKLPDLYFIEHLAVGLKYRKEGFGGKILQEGLSKTSGDVVLEIELPNDDVGLRRLSFYQKNGFFHNEYKYEQPPLNQGDKSIPMNILSYKKPLTEDEFLAVAENIYKNIYKKDMPDFNNRS